MHRVPIAPLVALFGLTLPVALAAQAWPSFRGPSGNGFTSAKNVAIEWSKDRNVKWRVPLGRAANGSPVVAAGRVFLTTPEDEEGRRRSLYCFDRRDGSQLWHRTVEIDRKMPTHGTNPYCGSTPAVDGERVVVWHGSAGLWCYDLEGKELWHRDFGEFRHRWGYGTSPVVHRGRVILHSGPGKKPFVACLDLGTGKTIWRQDETLENYGEDGMKPRLTGSWVTPSILTSGGTTRIVHVHPSRVVAYDFEDGRLLWSCGGVGNKRGDLAYSSPVVAGDLCYVQGGYNGPSLGVRLGANGDADASRRVWYHEDVASSVGTGVYLDGYIYMPFMRSVACIDPKDGTAKWLERPGKAQTWGSIVVAEGRMYLMDQSGTTHVFRPNPERFDVIAKNALGERTNATPAIADGEVFLRTHEALWCIAARPAAEKAETKK